MPSTYTTNNGIELPATGEQSGTWGDTVNTNMSIVDRLVTGVGTITLSGTTHTLTTTSGTLSDGMYRVLVFSGSPSGTNTVTISPNTQQKYYIVKNSSGQSVVLTQGSGGNVTVANGDVKIVYANGGGASAAVVDLTADLAMSSVNITGGTIDGSVIGGSSAAAGTFTTATVGAGLVGTPSLTTAGDTNTGLYFPAADTIAATTGGTERMRIDSSGNVGIGTSSPNVLLDLAGSSTTALARIANTGNGAGAFDGSGAGLELLARGMNNGANKYAPAIKFGSTDPDFTTTNPKYGAAIVGTAAQTYVSDTTGGMNLEFWTAPINPGTGSGLVERMRIDSSGNVGIGTSSPGATLNVAANTASDAVRITQTGTGNALVVEDSTNPDSSPVVIDSAGVVISGATTSKSSRISTSSITPGIQQVGATNNTSNIGIFGFGANPGLLIAKSNGTEAAPTAVANGSYIARISGAGFDGTNYTEAGSIRIEVDGTPGTDDMPGRLVFSTTSDGGSATTERMRIDSSGNVGIGTASPGQKLTVAGTVESTSGGFKFPDGTTQSSAASSSTFPEFLTLNAGVI